MSSDIGTIYNFRRELLNQEYLSAIKLEENIKFERQKADELAHVLQQEIPA